MASAWELDPDRPNAVEFMGKSFVLYQDTDEWVLVDNACSHRLAPLSEGRIDPATRRLECSYHGWQFEKGQCVRIPQVDNETLATAVQNPRCHVPHYPVQVHKNIIFAWPWPDSDPLDPQNAETWKWPEGLLEGVPANYSTYTRDLPYGWTTLVENIVDPAHVPFAHHGLQGKREDAVPIRMTRVQANRPEGFLFDFQDRTMKMEREATGILRAPYVVQYGGVFEPDKEVDEPKTFNLTTCLIPTKPGWSRIIIFGGPTEKPKEKKKGERFIIKLFRILPTWVVHQFSNRFLDSDLMFLHGQERELERNSQGYFLPAPADRCVTAWRQWVQKYAPNVPSGPLPEAPAEPFDRFHQHTDQCKYCSGALEGIQKWRKNAYRLLAVSVMLSKHVVARVSVVGCLLLLRILASIEPSLKRGGFKHYQNH